MRIRLNLQNIKVGKVISILALLIPAVFATIALCRSCSYERKMDELGYRLNSVTFQPRLMVVGNPVITEGRIDTVIVQLTPAQLLAPHSANDTLDIPIHLRIWIKTRLKVTNVGNSPASIVACAACDTTSDVPSLRRLLAHPEIIERSKQEFLPDYFHNELLPNAADTTEIEFEHEVLFVKNHRFTLHYLILYENDLGHVYDTYYWAEYAIADLVFPFPFELKGGRLVVRKTPPVRIATKDFAKLRNSNPSYKTYGIEEAKAIRRLLGRGIKQKTRDAN